MESPAPAPRVLVVEDEIAMASVVTSYLQREGFEVALAHNGPDAVGLARSFDPTVIVLDIMLPGFDGLEVCRQVRAFSDCYIVMLTARDEEVDKIVGLSLGADDYLVKPFSPRELVARVHAMLRRPRRPDASAPDHPTHVVGGFAIDTHARTVRVDGQDIEVTRTEFDILATLAARPRMAFSRRQIIEEVWGPDWFGDEHIVDVHVAHLRTKLGDPASEPRFIRTVRGVGYGMGAG